MAAERGAEAPAEAPRRLRLHGLTISGDLPVPGAEQAPPDAATDAEVRLGPAAPAGRGARLAGLWRVEPGGAAVLETEAGRFRVEDGRRVTVEPRPGAPAERLGLILAGWACAALLHQRGAPPLHAAALAGPEGALLLIGGPGAGKSTLTRLMAAEGLDPGGDDMTALDFAAGAPRAHRGPRTAKLFADSAAAAAGLASAGRTAASRAGYGKDVLVLPEAAGARWPAPVRAVVALEWLHPPDAPCELERLRPAAAMARLRGALAHPELAAALGLERACFPLLASLAAAAPVHVLRRPRRYEATGAAVAHLRRVLRDAAANGGSAP